SYASQAKEEEGMAEDRSLKDDPNYKKVLQGEFSCNVDHGHPRRCRASSTAEGREGSRCGNYGPEQVVC
ncbi:hypothetical protein THAOC_09055, partial [Thalassiosira oceanica]